MIAVAIMGVVAVAIVFVAMRPVALPTVSVLDNNGEDEPCGGNASCITGNVTKIIDGDTLDVGKTRVRLALVNTPEIGEPGYGKSKQFTTELCPVGSEVLVDEDDGQTAGSYGRMLAEVHCGENILNEQLLRAGLAQFLDNFCTTSEFAKENWAREFGC